MKLMTTISGALIHQHQPLDRIESTESWVSIWCGCEKAKFGIRGTNQVTDLDQFNVSFNVQTNDKHTRSLHQHSYGHGCTIGEYQNMSYVHKYLHDEHHVTLLGGSPSEYRYRWEKKR